MSLKGNSVLLLPKSKTLSCLSHLIFCHNSHPFICKSVLLPGCVLESGCPSPAGGQTPPSYGHPVWLYRSSRLPMGGSPAHGSSLSLPHRAERVIPSLPESAGGIPGLNPSVAAISLRVSAQGCFVTWVMPKALVPALLQVSSSLASSLVLL